jgi:para-nitrobenzyl esterase
MRSEAARTGARTIGRRRFLAQGSVVLVGAATALEAFGQIAPSTSSFVEVATGAGRVRGAQADGVVTFKGIPYAGPVSGRNRFKAAPPLQSWAGVRDALQPGAPAKQPNRNRANEPPPAEDCLFLNVWTPAADGRRRPVMFYSHGGGFTTGSAGAAYQDGSSLARTWDVVVVATNHRLGLMGYLYLGHLGGEEYATSGNQGLLDIRDGLKWVSDNIERFGGDPQNVMIFGESGGGAKTSCLYALPSAAPYFNKASIESGPCIRIYPVESAIATTEMVLKQLGLEKSQWRQLLEVPADTLVDVQVALGQKRSGPLMLGGGRRGISGNTAPGGFGPVLDGRILPDHPFDPVAPAISRDKPLVVGYNRDEMNFFFAQNRETDIYALTDATLKARLDRELGPSAARVLAAYRKSRPDASPADLYVAMASARFAGIGSITIAERKHAQRGAPVYMYVFTHESDRVIPGTTHTLGAAHAAEIVYKFNNVRPAGGGPSGQQPTAAGMSGDSRPGSVQTARNMSGFWSTFARTGRPAAHGQPAWPAYTTEQRATMFIEAECRVVNDPFSLERQVWDTVDV